MRDRLWWVFKCPSRKYSKKKQTLTDFEKTRSASIYISVANYGNSILRLLARLRRPPAAFLLNRAITRGANGTKTFPWLCQSYMQSFIKIGVLVFEKNDYKTMTLCNFNKDVLVTTILYLHYWWVSHELEWSTIYMTYSK